ncbi:MAG TPA: YihY/virulence factor BrkB family protein [Gemmatimonadales bacterium]|nr:YihY/virulence factor BrkB family protein [Gemmatimonadales bacterium]
MGVTTRGWHRSPWGFVKRTLQAADENNIPFLASALTFDALLAAVPFLLLLAVALASLAHVQAEAQGVDLRLLLERFLPPHDAGDADDPFRLVEHLLVEVSRNRGQISLLALPTFIWFSTRLFAGIRIALNEVFDVSSRPPRQRGMLASYLVGKLRDAVMVLATVVLFLANTLLTAGLEILETRAMESLPQLQSFLRSLGRLGGEALAFAFGVSLFFVIYKYASVRRLPWRAALIASVFAALAFELAKRLYGLYLANVARVEQVGSEANIGALVLFVLWVYYTAIVFLLGGVVAETWDLRVRQRKQRAVLI